MIENEGRWPRGFLNLWTRHDELCLRALIPLLYSRKRLDPMHIRADFLQPYWAKEALAAKKDRETVFISYKLEERILQSELLKRTTSKFENCDMCSISGTNHKPILFYPIIKLNLCFCTYKHVVCVGGKSHKATTVTSERIERLRQRPGGDRHGPQLTVIVTGKLFIPLCERIVSGVHVWRHFFTHHLSQSLTLAQGKPIKLQRPKVRQQGRCRTSF